MALHIAVMLVACNESPDPDPTPTEPIEPTGAGTTGATGDSGDPIDLGSLVVDATPPLRSEVRAATHPATTADWGCCGATCGSSRACTPSAGPTSTTPGASIWPRISGRS